MKNLILLFAVLSTLASSVFAQNEWIYNKNPKSSGWNIKKIKKFNRYIIDSTKVTGLVIVYNGQIIYDYGDIRENSYIASCRKSVLSMLYGKYVENGTIDLNKTLKELKIDDVKGILPIEQKATIRDLISARSGVYHPENYKGGLQQYAPKRGSVKPGTYWLYNNWDFNVAGFVFEQETKKSIYDEVEEQLVRPINMQDWNRNLQGKRGNIALSKYLAYPMWFSTRDMARIGLLMLNKGNWYGQQVIPRHWVDEMLKQRTTHQEINNNVPIFKNKGVNFGYGYMWWLFENMQDKKFKNAYAALGSMGQVIAVYPEINVVVAYKTKAAYRRSNKGKVKYDILKKVAKLYNPI
ncbi:serine hydrolase [Hyunsoonleella sp. SJ7]|uniref:Serine hydrolase n=1 Tax=Hyunsoonleella aquatilis TaxID=2762758 RepID=A0A923HB97_9FLAO|nr:serine hydrolase [Hyunsoonleella aquatilis]MBC3758637.1 serine hydrolase [Hyunsoonleella aquatilis]